MGSRMHCAAHAQLTARGSHNLSEPTVSSKKVYFFDKVIHVEMFRRKLTALEYHNPTGFDCTGKKSKSLMSSTVWFGELNVEPANTKNPWSCHWRQRHAKLHIEYSFKHTTWLPNAYLLGKPFFSTTLGIVVLFGISHFKSNYNFKPFKAFLC